MAVGAAVGLVVEIPVVGFAVGAAVGASVGHAMQCAGIEPNSYALHGTQTAMRQADEFVVFGM